LAQIRKIKNQTAAFEYFLDLLDPENSVWNAVKKHIQRETVSPIFLSAAVRHSFAHGRLTAYPTLVKRDKDTREETAITAISSISKILTKFLMHEMDRQFAEKVRRLGV
jgi:predicted transposase YbfD/YdcC